MNRGLYSLYDGNIPPVRSAPWMYTSLMESMPPQQGSMGQNRSDSLTGDSKALPDSKKMKTLAQRRQSAPSLVISKALTRSRSASRESCMMPVSPESCPLVQAFLAEYPGRLFLGHAQTQLKTGLQTQERQLFLFSDTLLIAKAKSPTHFKVKTQVRVCEMWTANCMDEVCEGSTNPERSFVMGWPTCNFVATFSSEDIKDKWLALISGQINEGKEKDDPKTIPLKIFAKDIGNCAYAKTLAVNNNDSTNDVIQVALQQFGISGCLKDHRLWVSSCKDDPPYPLIGHEFPFSIKMSHIRDGGSSPGGYGGGLGREPMSPTDCPEVLLLDQCLPPDTQCQFILKPNKVVLEPPQIIEPSHQKTFKRKRSLINWPFWKGSSTQLDGVPLSPSLLSPTQGRLFGQPLNSVCSSDHGLPKPVMDMLVFLYQEGPYTKGIFRRSAGAKACRELRDRLDSGSEEPEITHQSVFVIAAVLKDFLRNIPGSILCVDLYERWMDVMEGEGGGERLPAVERLLNLLPSENLLLLRHVIAVLHHIQGSAHDNQMNAFNLSVCIAPSMLWPPTPSTPDMEGEATKKVCELVRFLIENCSNVLGDVASLFKDISQKSNSDHGSDVSSFQMNDSSYDSLENELNDDPESPYQEQLLLREKAKPESRSRDSVITLSDGDPELDPDTDHLLQLPPLGRPRRFSPAVRQPRNGSSHGPRRLRRSSEPALALANVPSSGLVMINADNRHLPLRKASYDAAMEGEGEEDEVFVEQGLNRLQLNEEGEDECIQRGASGGRRKTKHAPPPPLRLDASCSSLSSPATSPTGSSLSSLDSAFSQYSTDYGTNGAATQQSPRDSPPQRDTLPHWQPSVHPPRGNQISHQSHGLHPNTWLKKDRCLSLRHPEGGHSEDLPVVNGNAFPASSGCSVAVDDAAAPNKNCQRRSSSPPSYQQALVQLQRSRSPFYRGAEKPLTVKELRQLHDQSCTYKCSSPTSPENPKLLTGPEVSPTSTGTERPQPPQSVFYGQTATTLVLQRPKSHSLTPAGEGHKGRKTLPRRASEPTKGSANSDISKSLTLDRPFGNRTQRKDGRLSASNVESSHSKTHLCLSPSATRVVRDYFSSQGQADADSCFQRSQEVAVAIVQGKKEWQRRRCSDPRLEDFEQLFFAEESYV
ncbi:rho GTPase-activating protein 20 isoform X2 [Fundulus heteroclitus]|uniref:rho GTPase-activating protein 20 isoform X2 n=1 Tax=Fundulus heteroclitus TaxID=8078 RepID=UPI00165AF324|nr:rho GTPase-activating protein 20 isoform X2 [Fundulus heteroclitus]